MLFRRTRILVATALVAAGSLCTAAPAHADPPAGLVACIGQASGYYTPGLTLLEPRDVGYLTNLGLGLCPMNDGVVAATYVQLGSLSNATCVTNFGNDAGSLTWQLVGGLMDTSTVEIAGATVLGQVYTALGSITSGRYAGRLVSFTVTLVPDLDDALPCLTPQGLTALNGLAAVVIL